MKYNHYLLNPFIVLIALFGFTLKAFAQYPAFLLAQQYKSGVDVTQYLISEKYDGVRAIWDGK